MPSPIERLEQRLAATVSRLLPEGSVFPETGIEKMRKTVERIRKEVGDRPPKPPTDRICGAIRKLREHGAAALDGAEFYFACWGLTERCSNHPMLIEDRVCFPGLMHEIQRCKPATLLWQGLLDAYFRYEPRTDQPIGLEHWQWLRKWLAQDLNQLRQRTSPGLVPHLPWMQTLTAQRNLLSDDDPCRPYAEEALRGEQERIDRINADLCIPETSWFWWELVNSQVDEATRWRDDGRFKKVLDRLIAQLRKHPTVKDGCLAKLLARYATCADKTAHEGLKQFAVETWGSPQLVRQARWGLVEPKVKEIVIQWLVLEDLHDFFELLQADGKDARRLQFWLRFIKQITFSHIVLGGDIWWSRDQDWLAFKQRKKERISRLDGGSANKNAFIMKIGDYYFVEFGEKGDACFGYAEGREPFKLGSGQVRYPHELKVKKKDPRMAFWGRHFDGRRKWEYTFLEALADLGVYPH